VGKWWIFDIIPLEKIFTDKSHSGFRKKRIYFFCSGFPLSEMTARQVEIASPPPRNYMELFFIVIARSGAIYCSYAYDKQR